jgi:hypothetical protein
MVVSPGACTEQFFPNQNQRRYFFRGLFFIVDGKVVLDFGFG